MRTLIIFGLLSITLICCQPAEAPPRQYIDDTSSIKIFNEVEAATSGLNFNNQITENSVLNAISFDGMLQGAGVGILDVNNDELPDIYFASNMQNDKLYLNKGDFKFEDISQKAGINVKNWSTGIAVVDINNDGFDDIYVCKFLYDEAVKRRNVFYINNGDGTFTDRAKEMGLADIGYSIMANFFDYDRDGDLDVYIANQPPNSLQGKGSLKNKIDYRFTDKLYKNNNGVFVDVTEASGIKNYSYSLSATTLDYNNDGWSDVYVACDYDEADFFYRNNGNGTFTNVANTTLKHMSNFSMGVDIADINNDGEEDIYVADMVAEDNFRQKTNMSGMNPAKFFALAKAGYHYQYMFNALQLNNGDNTFSEIAQMSGVSNTDWSWTPLFMDLDQDGNRDLIVTNGLMKEMRNKDYEIWRKAFFEQKLAEAAKTETKQLNVNPMEISNKAPSFKISNFVYKNEGDLVFSKQNSNWGFDKPTWSQGAAYADFDQDGDMDLVINNMNMNCGLYQNMANDNNLYNYITIELEGYAQNQSGINAQIEINYGAEIQVYENTPYRGYMSCSQRKIHFGLGRNEIVNQVKVIWPDNKMNVLDNVSANQNLIIKYADASQTHTRRGNGKKLFKQTAPSGIIHIENEFDDYDREILLPYRTSTLGPVMTKADVNADGQEDLFLGGSANSSSAILINNGKGGFSNQTTAFNSDKQYEDGGAHFFDFDGDNDLDLYVSSGGNEFNINSNKYQDRLYKNDGKGNFTKVNILPQIKTSTSAISSFDFDGDGDLDLFIGGRQLPGKYGIPVSSYILENNNGKFVDVTKEKAKTFIDFGMVTDAKAADIDNDGKVELVTVGEWMPVQIFEVGSGQLVEDPMSAQLADSKGWWNVVEFGDIDKDGDLDLVCGNLGLNIKYKASKEQPFKLFVDDFDGNGTHDVYLGFYENGKCFPVRGRQCSSQQMPFVKEKFKSYQDFGVATIDKVLEGHMGENTVVQEAYTFSNSVFINEGEKFIKKELPNMAQIAPVYGISIDDFDKNGTMDIFLAGNMYQREVETTRSDAGKGYLVTMNPAGDFHVQGAQKTGVSADRDVRDIVHLKSGNKNLLVIANNNDEVQMYQY